MEEVGRTPPDGITPEEWAELVRLWVEAPDFTKIGTRNMRALLTGLSRECPFGGNPEDCCMHQIRKMPFKERFEWVLKLSDVEMEMIYNRHVHCSRCKNNDLRGKSKD